jgi:endonuclease/exonuclease/phosphatase family metal-dependent hydrolase
VLIRSWNLFHGNSSPPGRRSHLEEMVRLASADHPDVLLLQELPAWALARVGGWSGMTAVADVAQRPTMGPVPIPTGLGHLLTALHPGVLRSAFSGQGNAILLGAGLEPAAHEVLTLNPRDFRRRRAGDLGLGLLARLAWAKERRVCQAVRVEPRLVIANLHATSFPGDPRVPEVELERAFEFVEGFAHEGDAVVLGGDFNVEPGSAALGWGDHGPGPRIDHVLVRGAEATPLRVWPDERRRRDGMLFSDHAPVELDVTL